MVEGVLMAVKKHIQEYQGPLPGVPLHLRPGSTQLMRDIGYGKGYVHSAAAGDQCFLPDSIKGVDFFKDCQELFVWAKYKKKLKLLHVAFTGKLWTVKNLIRIDSNWLFCHFLYI